MQFFVIFYLSQHWFNPGFPWVFQPALSGSWLAYFSKNMVQYFAIVSSNQVKQLTQLTARLLLLTSSPQGHGCTQTHVSVKVSRYIWTQSTLILLLSSALHIYGTFWTENLETYSYSRRRKAQSYKRGSIPLWSCHCNQIRVQSKGNKKSFL